MRRWKYFGVRLLLAVPVIPAIVVMNFFLIQLAPGDAVSVLAGESGAASEEYMDALRQKFGLDQPLYVQFFDYVRNVAQLDLGYSFRNDEAVLGLVVERLGSTLLLTGSAFLIALVIGSVLGLLAAARHGTWLDSGITFLVLIGYATPGFWLGLMMIVLFAINLGWLPTSGIETIGADYRGWEYVLDVGRHLIMPMAALAFFNMAVYARVMRGAVLEEIDMDYVTTARAKGKTESGILLGHVLRNALLPVVTMAGVQASQLIGGSIVIEAVFGWPGIGTLAFNALQSRDLNLLLGIFLVSALAVVLINIVVDFFLVLLDPRIGA